MTSTELWASVREYVEKQCPGLPQAKFDKATVAVYEAMRFLVEKPKRPTDSISARRNVSE